jgi:riboflavin synthase
MFTGIAKELGVIHTIVKNDVITLEITCGKVLEDLERGSSINVNGVCLTVMKKSGLGFTITIIPETFDRTAFRYLKQGDFVNLEPPMKLGEPLTGGMVSGLVDGVGVIQNVILEKKRHELVIDVPTDLMKFIAPRTGVVIDGIGLNTKEVEKNRITIALYPYVTAHTTLGKLQKNDNVNIEVSSTARVIVHYLEQTGKSDIH